MTLAVQQRQATGTVVDTLDEKARWCQMMADGDMLPRQFRGKPANLLFAIEYADALGIPRVNALTSVHVIEGKPSASADLMASMVRKAGHKLRVTVEGRGKQATVTAQLVRADDPDFTFSVTWTWQDAIDAKLQNKDNWMNYPTAMMKARAISAVIREGASDAMFGVIYTPEELGAVVDVDGNPVRTVTSNMPTRAESVRADVPPAEPTVAHPLQQDTPPPAPSGRATIDIAADVVNSIDGDAEAVRELWREARSNGHAELVEAISALMKGSVTADDFVTDWIAGPQDDGTAPENAASAPQDAPQDAPALQPVHGTADAAGGDVIDAELMLDVEGEQ